MALKRKLASNTVPAAKKLKFDFAPCPTDTYLIRVSHLKPRETSARASQPGMSMASCRWTKKFSKNTWKPRSLVSSF